MRRLGNLNRPGIVSFSIAAVVALCSECASAQERTIISALKGRGGDREEVFGVRNDDDLRIFRTWMTITPVTVESEDPSPTTTLPGSDDDSDQVETDQRATTVNGQRALLITWMESDRGSAFHQRIFGGRDAESAWQNLEEGLRVDVDDLVAGLGLLPYQREKLMAAGRGDIKRHIDRVERVRHRFSPRIVADVHAARQLYRELSALSNELEAGFRRSPFGDGSLFAKTLNHMLGPEEIAAYRKRPVVTRSWNLKVK